VQQAGAALLRVRADAAPPPFGLLAIGGDGRMTAFSWGGPSKTTALDGETHRRPLWHDRNAGRLAAADREMQDWLDQHTVPLSIKDVVPGGYSVHTVQQGAKVNFTSIFRSATRAPIWRVDLQDPYLSSYHQLKCLKDFLGSIPWRPAEGVIPFHLRTHLSEPKPRDSHMVPTVRHQDQLRKAFSLHPVLTPEFDLARRWPRPFHMGFVVLTLADGLRWGNMQYGGYNRSYKLAVAIARRAWEQCATCLSAFSTRR
jgi:hypothetical protein